MLLITFKRGKPSSVPASATRLDGWSGLVTDADVSERDSENSKVHSDHQTSDIVVRARQKVEIFLMRAVWGGTHLIDAFA